MAIPREACIDIAAELGCDIPAIRAVAEVESGGRTNLKVFLFEPHWFSRLTSRRWDATHPDVSYPRWDRKKYPKTLKAKMAQFGEACVLDSQKAYESCSWGLFQIMGYHYLVCDYESAMQMALALQNTIDANVVAFGKVIRYMKLDDELRNHQWDLFARKYNGPEYFRNHYDLKIERAYTRFSGGR